ncbi:class I SAM-dependent methyltransferase [Bradyrhizobium sp. AUGA SZCCT0176]|uniref:class I SAM-dependent methyltransferase n=1 Tax=Bradyrhizobium sp. AUGA SZCCT0176 TaxID=2807664 RepID=UPI001BA5E79F|nr:class I SAM-dependent methyltransferase [Bradyrhizobium sp. AUGA SZCCT0176]MBR1229219.1 class I SAM-dependent methyltransferase [Bradyrhizobium sp. AUGA SZCCT0176]
MSVPQRYPDFLSDQRQFFDELITEEWQTYFSEEWDAIRRFEIEKIFEHFKPARILDVGCGVGFHDAEMARYDFVEEVDAFDYSEKSVEKANATYSHPKVKRFVADLSTFAPTNRYDMVISFQVFEHLDQPPAYFELCRRSCKAGAIVAIVTPNRTRLSNRLRARKGLPYELCDPQHFKEYTIGEIHELGAQAGFTPAGGFGYRLWGWPPLERLSLRTRLNLGFWFPSIAHGIVSFLRAP